MAISYVTSMDHRDYFDMWALTYSVKAGSQVEDLNYPLVPRQYFISNRRAYCLDFDKPSVAVDGNQE